MHQMTLLLKMPMVLRAQITAIWLKSSRRKSKSIKVKIQNWIWLQIVKWYGFPYTALICAGDKKDKQRNQAENEAQNDLPIGHGARTIDEIKATYGQGREQVVLIFS